MIKVMAVEWFLFFCILGQILCIFLYSSKTCRMSLQCIFPLREKDVKVT